MSSEPSGVIYRLELFWRLLTLEAAMDMAKFEEWLSGMTELTLPQRREAWRRLALSGLRTAIASNTRCPRGRLFLTLGKRRCGTICRFPYRLGEHGHELRVVNKAVRVGAQRR